MLFSALKQNLLAGLRIARAEKFAVGRDQVVALALLCVGVIVALSFPIGAKDFVIDWTGLTSWAAIGFLVIIFLLAIVRVQKDEALPFVTQILSSAPWFLAVVLLFTRLWPGMVWLTYSLTLLGFLLVLFVALRSFGNLKAMTVGLLLLVAIAVPNVGWYRFITPNVFYVMQQVSADPVAAIDVERVFRQQQTLVGETVTELLPQRPDHPDIYFVGFAGNADEPVFGRDVNWVRDWFDANLDTLGRSVVLSANHATLQSELLASPHNLHDVLVGLGQLFDPNEDSIFLYLTSHGSAAGYLDVSLGAVPLQPLRAEFIRHALDESGIRWRIIVISACYAGSFIDTLADEQTLIITAASADKMSFGCGWESDMTWFSDAFFRQSLDEGIGLLAAFEKARQHIETREAEEGIAASDPQIFIGDAMKKRLESIVTAVGLIE